MPQRPPSSRFGSLGEDAAEGDHRRRVIEDPGRYHGDIAASELHWYDPDLGAWLNRDPETGGWSGHTAKDGAEVGSAAAPARPTEWRPWETAFDDSEAPFYRWFAGARTNACFNELDRHVLAGRGEDTALIFEGDRWDPSRNDGVGGPVVQQEVRYRELLSETVIRAEVLSGLGLAKGDRIAFNLPNILEQIYYTEAAKRLGIIYTPVFGGFSAKTLSDRIHDAGARVVVTADGGYRNAEVVPYKERFTDAALDNYIPSGQALGALRSLLTDRLAEETADRIQSAVAAALEGEITLERGDLMRELGRALAREPELGPGATAELRTAVARALAGVEREVERVVVVRYTGQEIVERPRDVWSGELVEAATERVLERARDAGFEVRS
ncbi:MAG: AMP-binding protein, partial [Gemmatimonadota bacterium]